VAPAGTAARIPKGLYIEHQHCAVISRGGIDRSVVWFSCECGGSIARRVPEEATPSCLMRESTGTEKKREAETFLKDREGRAARGEAVLPRSNKVPWEEAAADLREHYRTTGSREPEEAD
jgi:hypothetical protein